MVYLVSDGDVSGVVMARSLGSWMIGRFWDGRGLEGTERNREGDSS